MLDDVALVALTQARRVSSASAVELRPGCVGPFAGSGASVSMVKYW